MADLPKLGDDGPTNWSEFVQALRSANQFWLQYSKREFSVIPADEEGKVECWIATIRQGESVVRNARWDHLKRDERHVLLGRGRFPLLGRMANAQLANHIFMGTTDEDRNNLRYLRESLSPLLATNATDQAIDAACAALKQIASVGSIGPGVATRLLALAKPSVCVSVNNGSRKELARLTNLPRTTLGTPENYRKLLSWVVQQPWYRAEQPSNPWEACVWSMRAALIDCFVSEPKPISWRRQ